MNKTAVLTSGSETEAHLEAMVRSIPDAVISIDPRGAIDFLNPAAEDLFGYPAEEAIGRSFAALLAEPHQEEYAAQMRDHAALGTTPTVIGETRELIGRHRDGSTFAIEMVLTDLRPMEQRMLVAVARDIRERKREQARLRNLADHDESTDLLNRHCFEQELTRHIQYSARYGHGGSVVSLDVDDFKKAGESMGPDGGEKLVRALAVRLSNRLRKTDVIARLGEDELGVLLHGAGRATALNVAEELLALIRKHPFTIGGQPVWITASAGLAAVEERPITGAELLTEAEVALRAAKEAGKGCVIGHARGEHEEQVENTRLLSERVREATERGLFVLVCQPVVDLESKRISQRELLLRLRGEDGELTLPGVFLSAAERFKLTGGIDRWVTQQAIRLIAAHRDEDRELILEVNLSAETMGDSNFPVQVQSDLTTTGIDPSLLVFEVSEAVAVADIERAQRMASELTALGCRFALDDFGADLASLYQLKHLPLSYLKIDGEFVQALPRIPTDQLIVRALVDVCRGLGIKTIAEFVEDEPTLEMLTELGVDFAQGYFLGHPHPVADLDPRG